MTSTIDRTWIQHAKDRSGSASSWKSNIRFVDSPTVPHREGHDSSIRTAMEVNEHLMECLFDDLSNRSSPTSIIHWQGLQIIKTYYQRSRQVLWRRCGLVINTWGPGPSWSTPQPCVEHTRKPMDALPLGHILRRPARVSKSRWNPIVSSSSPSRNP
jgi:hypothetical protein